MVGTTYKRECEEGQEVTRGDTVDLTLRLELVERQWRHRRQLSVNFTVPLHIDSTWTSLKVRAIMWSQTIPLCSRYTPSRILMDSIRKHTIEGLLLQSCQHQSRSPYGLHLESIKCQINIIPTQKIMPTSGFEHPTSNKWPKWTRLTAELPVHIFLVKIGK